MKKLLVLVSIVSSSIAFGHGTPAHQVAEAVEVATELFEANNRREVRFFKSVTGVHTSYDHADVVIVTEKNDKDGNVVSTEFSYKCAENEELDKWECAAE